MLDTSVLLRFLAHHPDAEQPAADDLLGSWLRGEVVLVLLDLSVYECVNVLVRRMRMEADEVAAVVRRLFDLGFSMRHIGEALAVGTARLAATTALSGYDAAFVALADDLEAPLITADRRLAEEAGDSAVLLTDLGG